MVHVVRNFLTKIIFNIYILRIWSTCWTYGVYFQRTRFVKNKPPYPVFLFPVMIPGKRVPEPGLSSGLSPGDGVGCFIGVGNPIPGDGVGVTNWGDGNCILIAGGPGVRGPQGTPNGAGDGVFDGGTIPRGAWGLSNRIGKFNVGNGDAWRGAGAVGPGAANLGPKQKMLISYHLLRKKKVVWSNRTTILNRNFWPDTKLTRKSFTISDVQSVQWIAW